MKKFLKILHAVISIILIIQIAGVLPVITWIGNINAITGGMAAIAFVKLFFIAILIFFRNFLTKKIKNTNQNPATKISQQSPKEPEGNMVLRYSPPKKTKQENYTLPKTEKILYCTNCGKKNNISVLDATSLNRITCKNPTFRTPIIQNLNISKHIYRRVT